MDKPRMLSPNNSCLEQNIKPRSRYRRIEAQRIIPGIFINKFNRLGTSGVCNPNNSIPAIRLSVQLSWYSVTPNNWHQYVSHATITISWTPPEVSSQTVKIGQHWFICI